MGLTYSQFDYFGVQDQWEKDHRYSPQREYIADTHIESLKNIIIEGLRDVFSKHQGYQYIERTDGIPGPDLDKTKICITDVYSYEAKFLPIITVRVTSSNTKAISFNQDVGTTDYLYDEEGKIVYDNWGRPVPIYYQYNGAWDSSVQLNIFTESTIEREELTTFVSVVCINLLRDLWRYQGMFVKTVNVGGESETAFANDYIYQQQVMLDVYSEWTRRIPVPTEILEGFNYNIETKGGASTSTETKLIVPVESGIADSIFYNGVSWQVRSVYRELLADHLDLLEAQQLLTDLVDKVNNSGTQLLTTPISHSLTSFATININDFFLLRGHIVDSLRQDGLDMAKQMKDYISTLTDSGEISTLTVVHDRLRNIEKTLTGQLIEIDTNS